MPEWRPNEKLIAHAEYLRGLADGFYHGENVTAARRLAECADWLAKTARNTCGADYVGCRGGQDCTSDHK